MKNILVALLLLVASQMLVAVSQEMKLELNDPNDCGYLEKSILPYILPTCSISEEDIHSVINVKPDKNKVVESNDREKGPNPTICFNGDCGVIDNKINSKIIRVK